MFEKNHPMLCCMWLLRLQLDLQNIATSFLTAWGTVMLSAQPYNAAEKETCWISSGMTWS
jgi:hypothetical protein